MQNSGSWTKAQVSWASVSKITRFGFESSIWGVTTDGKLFVLWNDGGTIRSDQVVVASTEDDT